ncbi:MAG: prolyl oligopeptidase family serine peptidase [Actinomycetota bacterium]
MKFENELENNKDVSCVELVDFGGVINGAEKKEQRKIKELLVLAETYRFLYAVNSKKVVGYISIPKHVTHAPCLIHLRGGGGDFSMLQESSILEKLVKFSMEGYVVITTQYPGVEGGDGSDAYGGQEDILSIIKLKDILESISVADTRKIGVKGHSRGGLMAYMLLRKVDWVTCAVIGSAPVDQIQLVRERSEWREYQISMWGYSKNDAIDRSPIYWSRDLPENSPLLLVHGSSDERVDVSHSLRMNASLDELSIPHEFILFEGDDHGITRHKQEYFDRTLNWFNRFLR